MCSLYRVRPLNLSWCDHAAHGCPLSSSQVSLASVRCPRLANPKAKEEGSADDEPWAVESKEWTRSSVMGVDKLMMKIDYTRVIGESSRPFVSLYHKNHQNLAVKLVQAVCACSALGLTCGQGLASCIPHRDNDDRSADYADLLAGENQAKESGRCMFGSRQAPSHRVNNMSLNAQKGQAFLQSLQREQPVAASPDPH